MSPLGAEGFDIDDVDIVFAPVGVSFAEIPPREAASIEALDEEGAIGEYCPGILSHENRIGGLRNNRMRIIPDADGEGHDEGPGPGDGEQLAFARGACESDESRDPQDGEELEHQR